MKTLVFPGISDSEIVTRVVEFREYHLFSLLIKKYSSKVQNTCYSFLKHKKLAEEFAVEIFALAFEKLSGFKQNASFSTWLYSITKNYCLTKLYEQKLNNSRHCSIADFTDIFEDDDEINDKELSIQKLELALLELSNTDQQIIHLKYIDEMKIKDIASMLHIKESAIKMRLLRAKQHLKQVLVNNDS